MLVYNRADAPYEGDFRVQLWKEETSSSPTAGEVGRTWLFP